MIALEEESMVFMGSSFKKPALENSEDKVVKAVACWCKREEVPGRESGENR